MKGIFLHFTWMNTKSIRERSKVRNDKFWNYIVTYNFLQLQSILSLGPKNSGRRLQADVGQRSFMYQLTNSTYFISIFHKLASSMSSLSHVN